MVKTLKKRVNLARGGKLRGTRQSRIEFGQSRRQAESGNQSVQPTVGTQSVSGPSGASKPAPSVEYSKSALGEKVKTVTDGKTSVVTSQKPVENVYGPRTETGNALRQIYFNQNGKWPPCINTSCRSYGKSHPNCLCYSDVRTMEMAHGGQVHHACDTGQPHRAGCEHAEDPGHTLAHAAVGHGLLGLLKEVGRPSRDPQKNLVDYLEQSHKGEKALKSHSSTLIGKGDSDLHDADEKKREELKDHLQDLEMNPGKMLDIGGNLQHERHRAQIAATAGTAINYLRQFKPTQTKLSPLDEVTPIDKMSQAIYDRHLDIANDPLLVLKHAKTGKLHDADMQTIQTLYPKLYKSMLSHVNDSLIDAKTKDVEIPYRQKQGLSTLLGESLDTTLTQSAMQAIMMSQSPKLPQNQKSQKASSTELNQLNKVNDMSATSLQRRQLDKHD